MASTEFEAKRTIALGTKVKGVGKVVNIADPYRKLLADHAYKLN